MNFSSSIIIFPTSSRIKSSETEFHNIINSDSHSTSVVVIDPSAVSSVTIVNKSSSFSFHSNAIFTPCTINATKSVSICENFQDHPGSCEELHTNCQYILKSNNQRLLKKHIKRCARTWVCEVAIKEGQDQFSGGNFLTFETFSGRGGKVSASPDKKHRVRRPYEDRITKLDVFLGSENFNAKYRVKICFETGKALPLNGSVANPLLPGTVSMIGLSHFTAKPLDYIRKSNLRTSVNWKCKPWGNFPFERISVSSTNTSASPFHETFGEYRTHMRNNFYEQCEVSYTYSETMTSKTREHDDHFVIDTDTIIDLHFR